MEIKTGRRIQIECQNTDKEWTKKWVAVDDEIIKAVALYRHVKNHKEVQEAESFPGMPICKICNKPSILIAREEPLKELTANEPSTKQ